MSIIIRNKSGEIVSESKNLAMLRRRPAKHKVKVIHVDRLPETTVASDGVKNTGLDFGGKLTVKFANGDWSMISFGSYQLLCHWVGNWNAVIGTKLIMDDKRRGTISKNNVYLQRGNQ